MSYQLGIDFGTTFVAAAVRRADGPAQAVPLSSAGVVVPAALHLARDGGVTVGEGALRLAGIDPGRVVRAVKRRVGDPAPVVAGGREWSAEDLSARLVRWVVDRVAEREGGDAAGVVLAHPATWPAPVLERLALALDRQGVAATFLAEPQAVALAHVAAGGEVGDTVAVYDLGGGRCETAVLRRTAGWPGFALLGRPGGLPDVGGLDLDEVLGEHVRGVVASGSTADARTRRACTRAKEMLSSRSAVVVRVGQGELRGEVPLERATFENLVRPHVARTVAALRRTLASAELGAGEPATVLLAGGSSRIPLVAHMVADALGRPVTPVDEPELVVARGAALAGAEVGPAAAEVTDTVRVTVTKAAAQVAPETVTVEFPAPVSVPAEAAVMDAAAMDAAAMDAAAMDAAASDAAASDTGATDTPATDTRAADVGASDTGATDTRASDTGATDTRATDTRAADTRAADVGASDSGASDTGATDTGATDTRAMDVGATDIGATDAGVAEPGDPDSGSAEPAMPVPAVAEPVVPAAPRRVAPRPPAVLDGPRRGARRRSLPRLLVGASALVVAALVVVALFRPDGPLDPPTEAVGRDVTVRSTGAPVAPAPAVAPVPGQDAARAGGVPPVRTTAPVRIQSLTDDGPVDIPADARTDPARSSVDTTPPAAPQVRTAGGRPVSGGVAPAPLGAAPHVPPTPVAPGV